MQSHTSAHLGSAPGPSAVVGWRMLSSCRGRFCEGKLLLFCLLPLGRSLPVLPAPLSQPSLQALPGKVFPSSSGFSLALNSGLGVPLFLPAPSGPAFGCQPSHHLAAVSRMSLQVAAHLPGEMFACSYLVSPSTSWELGRQNPLGEVLPPSPGHQRQGVGRLLSTLLASLHS